MTKTTNKYPPFRADIVGSFLRPPALLEARKRFNGDLETVKNETAKPDWLTNEEDAAIESCFAFRKASGLKSRPMGNSAAFFTSIRWQTSTASPFARTTTTAS